MFNSGYHREHDEGFGDKVATLAKYAGIAALTIGSASLIGKAAGGAIARGLGDSYSPLRKILGSAASNDSKMVFSDGLNFFSESVPRIRRTFLSGALRAERKEALMNTMRATVHEDSLEAFDKSKETIASHFEEFYKEERGLMGSKVLGDTNIKRFMESTTGIRFKYMQSGVTPGVLLEQHREAIRGSMLEAIDLTKEANITSRKLFAGEHGSKNYTDLIGGITKTANQLNARELAGLEAMGLTKSHKILSINDLVGEHQSAVRRYFDRAGIKDKPENIVARAFRGTEKLFTHKDSTLGPEEALNGLREVIGNTSSGLAIDANGDVVSLVHAKNTRKKLINIAKQKFQIPLLPYSFNVPLSIGSYLKPDENPIKSLEKMSNYGELRRLGHKFSENEFGIGIGENIFSIDPTQNGYQLKQITSANAKRFVFLNNEMSDILTETANARSKQTGGMTGQFKKHVEEKGWFKGTLGFIGERGEDQQLFPEKMLEQHQDKLYNLTLEDGSLNLRRKTGVPYLKDRLGVSSDDIHPLLAAEFLRDNSGQMPASLELDLMRRATSSGADTNYDTLHRTTQKLKFNNEFLHNLALASGDVNKLEEILSSTDLNPLTNKHFGPTLSKALADYVENPSRLRETAAKTSTIYDSLNPYISKDALFGQTSVSQIHKDVQRGLIEEYIRDSGVGELDTALTSKVGLDLRGSLIHLNAEPLSEKSKLIEETLNNHSGLKNKPLKDFDINEIANMASPGFEENGELVESVVGNIGSAFGRHSGIEDLIDDPIARLIAAERHRADVMIMGSTFHSEESAVENISRLSDSLDVHESLFKTRNHGFDFGEEHVPATRYTVLPAITPSLGSLLTGSANNLGEAIKQQMVEAMTKGFGIPGFVKSLGVEDAPQGYASTVFTSVSKGGSKVLSSFGLGLPEEDNTTFVREVASVYIKRIVPAFVGLEIYKNYNADMHRKGQDGIDDGVANLYGNARINKAKAMDHYGLTGLAKKIVHGTPGLDMYMHPLTEEETRQDLFYGNETVRMGRFFVVGSRNPLYGGSVEGFRPNLYRRLKSHWTEADNVQLSNPEYSYLPTLTNPLAPINRLLHPHWAQDLTAKDRPYASQEELLEHLEEMPVGYAPHRPVPGLQKIMEAVRGVKNHFGHSGGGGVGPGGELKYGHGAGGAQVPGGTGEAVSTEAMLAGSGEEDKTSFFYGYNNYGQHSDYHAAHVRGNLTKSIEHIIRPTGIYSGIVKQLPFYPHHNPAFETQDEKKAFSNSKFFYGARGGEILSQLYGEFFRRFVEDPRQDPDAFNPLPNTQPSWLPERFHRGDPYSRTPFGELNLPGDAYQQVNPYARPMRVRGSMIGQSEDELVESFLNPVKSETNIAAEERMEYGTLAHRLIMRQMREQGILLGAETAAYDADINGTATIDSLVRGKTGMEPLEIKTRGSNNINEDNEKYIDQLMYYMYLTKAKQGHLVHVNRDNPNQVRVATYQYDQDRIDEMFGRVERARARVQAMVDSGEVSPYETYGIIDRIEILAKVAPESKEYRAYVKQAKESGAFGGMEEKRFQAAIEQGRLKTENFNLYPLRGAPTETRDLLVEGVTGDGEILTEQGKIKLAGVKWGAQAFSYKEPEDVLAQYGIHIGEKSSITLLRGQFNPSVMSNTTLEAIIGDTNEELIDSDYAERDYASRHPLANQVFGSNGIIADAKQSILHSDNLFSNKFLRVRSGLEQFKRGEVYGTDDYSLTNIYDNYVYPTISSIVSKDPIRGAIAGGVLAGMFIRGKADRVLGMKVGAAIGASLSLIRGAEELITGNRWTPKRYRKSEEFEEYYDILNFIKESTIGEKASQGNPQKHLEKEKEGVIARGLKRISGAHDAAQVHATLQGKALGEIANDSNYRASRTMYGFDTINGTLDEALQTLPNKHKQIARSIIETGSEKEKNEFYGLLGNAEKRVLGKFLGVPLDNLPERPKLEHYFKTHMLPESDWAGWSRDANLQDIETRARDLEGIKINRPSRKVLKKAQAFSRGISVPRMKKKTKVSIQKELDKLVSTGEFKNIIVDYGTNYTDDNVIDIELNFTHNKRDEIDKEKEKLINA